MRAHYRFIVTFASCLALAGPVAAFCGDGLIESGEQCDLGVANCEPAVCCETSCDSTCQLIGRCTGDRGCCSNDSECTAGEGCCGNGVIEGSEQCDDGNRINGDCCSTSCESEPGPCVPLPDECGALGPLNVLGNPSIRRMTLRDSRPVDGNFDLFARDRFVLPDGLDIDPDTEIVSFTFSENDGANGARDLYRATLDPALCTATQCFKPFSNASGLDKKWEYRRAGRTMASAPGWDMARLIRNLSFPAQIKEAYTLRDTTIAPPELVDGRRRTRLSIVVGDVCVTRLLDCGRNNRGTRFTCREIHCGDGIRQRGEQCGEPGLSCRASKTCDSCRCVAPLP